MILFNLCLLGQYLQKPILVRVFVLYSALQSRLDYRSYSLAFFLCLLSMANKDSFIHSFIHSFIQLFRDAATCLKWWGGVSAVPLYDILMALDRGTGPIGPV